MQCKNHVIKNMGSMPLFGSSSNEVRFGSRVLNLLLFVSEKCVIFVVIYFKKMWFTYGNVVHFRVCCGLLKPNVKCGLLLYLQRTSVSP